MNPEYLTRYEYIHPLFAYLINPEECTLGGEVEQRFNKLSLDIHTKYGDLSTSPSNDGMTNDTL